MMLPFQACSNFSSQIQSNIFENVLCINAFGKFDYFCCVPTRFIHKCRKKAHFYRLTRQLFVEHSVKEDNNTIGLRFCWFFFLLSLSLIPPFWCYIRKKIAVIIGRKKGKKIIWFVVHDVLYRSFYTRFSPEILNRYNRHNKISKRFFSKVCECVWLLVFRYIRKTDTTADETDLRSQSRLVLNSHCSSKNTDWILCLRCVALCVSERVSELRSWSCRLPL